jgi:tetratricopeptide (TPR) repeat protein
MQSLQQYRRLGHVAGEALCLNNIGAMQMDRGEYEAAGSHLRAGLALSELHDLVSTRGLLLANLTELAVKTDATQAAQQYAGLALELARHIGARTVESWLEMQLAQIALRNGEPAGARLHLRSSLEISIDIDRPALRLAGVSVFAEILAAEGHLDCARRVLAFAAEHPSMPANGRDDLLARLARWGTTPETASWPGLDLAALVDRIVVETDVAHAPLIALLNERR